MGIKQMNPNNVPLNIGHVTQKAFYFRPRLFMAILAILAIQNDQNDHFTKHPFSFQHI